MSNSTEPDVTNKRIGHTSGQRQPKTQKIKLPCRIPPSFFMHQPTISFSVSTAAIDNPYIV